jgi:RNA polymerase sigma-70 factor (ECF subfamily)
MIDTSTQDAHLFEAWRAGDRRAGEQLFERHFDAIYRFFQTKVSGDVSDLVQRTFVGCVEAADRFRRASSFRTFLYAIARNELYGHYRAKKRDERLDFSVSSAADLSPGISTMARKASERAALAEALKGLPLELQVALELHYWEGLVGPEIAEVLGVPEGTVRSRLRRGLEQLRDAVRAGPDRGFFPDASDDPDGWADRLARSRGSAA